MVPFSVNAVQDLLAMDCVAKEVGLGVNVTKLDLLHSGWCLDLLHYFNIGGN